MKNSLRFLFTATFILLFSNTNAQWTQTGGPQGGPANCLEKVGTDIWAGMGNGIYVSGNEGQSWKKYPLVNDYVSDILCFNDTVIVIYQVLIGYQSPDVDVYAITSFDGGTNWTPPHFLYNDYYSNNNQLAKANNRLFLKFEWDYFYSDDFGLNWTQLPLPAGTNMYGLGSMNNVLWTTIGGGAPFYQSYISYNAAQTWQLLDTLYSSSFGFLFTGTHAFFLPYTFDTLYHAIVIRKSLQFQTYDTVFIPPANTSLYSFGYLNGTIYLSDNISNTFSSSNGGLTWVIDSLPILKYRETLTLSNGDWLGIENLNTQNIKRYVPSQNSSFETTSGIKSQTSFMLRQHKNVLYESTRDKLHRSTDAGQTWFPTSFPSGLNPASDMIYIGDTLVAISRTNISRSFDNGVNWDTLNHPAINTGFGFCSIENIEQRLFIAGDSMYYSDDFGLTWNVIADPPDTISGAACSYLPSGSHYPWLKAYNNQLFCVTNDGVVFKFDSVAQIWNQSFCFYSPGTSNGNYLYIVDSALVMAGRLGIFFTINNGATWTTAALNGLPIQGLSPVVPRSITAINGIWFGTCGSYGVYASNDLGNNWAPTYGGSNAPFFAQGGMAVLNNVLFSGSSGNSVWQNAGTFETITGTVYNDVNNNGIKDAGENGYPNIVVRIATKGWYATTDSSGNYTITTDAVGDTLLPMLPVFFASCTPTYYLTNGAASNKDFGIYIPPNVADLSIDLTNIYKFVPGFTTLLNLSITNKGSIVQPAQVQYINDQHLTYYGSNLTPLSVNGDTITWITDTLQFLESKNIHVIVETDSTTLLGDSIKCFASVTPVVNDTVPADNYTGLLTVAVASQDPNDKQCVQGAYFTPAQLAAGQEMQFIVRFQNTGNFPASFVYIIDTLSSYLDLSTFRVISASHTMQYSLSQFGIARFDFNNINLPPSSVDEPNSHGYIKYGARCKQSVVIGNAVTNTASIYFDFNPPVQTNTTTTLIAYPIPVEVEENIAAVPQIKVYPNPAKENLNIDMSQFTEKDFTLIISNANGKIISTEKIKNTITAKNVSGLTNGIYFGMVVNPHGKKAGAFRFVLNK